VKREIYCEKDAKSRFKETNPYHNEFVTKVFGRALRDCFCDWCGRPISEQETVAAISIYIGTEHKKIAGWEHDYIELNKSEGA